MRGLHFFSGMVTILTFLALCFHQPAAHAENRGLLDRLLKLGGVMSEEDSIKAIGQQIFDELLLENAGISGITCVGVSELLEIAPNVYSAKALLNIGGSIDVKLQRSGDMVYLEPDPIQFNALLVAIRMNKFAEVLGSIVPKDIGVTEMLHTPEYIVSATSLNVRRQPGTDSPTIGKLPQGTRIQVVEVAPAIPWVKVSHPSLSEVGFVHAHYLEFDGATVGDFSFASVGSPFDLGENADPATRLVGRFTEGQTALLALFDRKKTGAQPVIQKGTTVRIGDELAPYENPNDPNASKVPITDLSVGAPIRWDEVQGFAVVGKDLNFRGLIQEEVKDNRVLETVKLRAGAHLNAEERFDSAFRRAFKVSDAPGELILACFSRSDNSLGAGLAVKEYVLLGAGEPTTLYVGVGIEPYFFSANGNIFVFYSWAEPETDNVGSCVFQILPSGTQLVYVDY